MSWPQNHIPKQVSTAGVASRLAGSNLSGPGRCSYWTGPETCFARWLRARASSGTPSSFGRVVGGKLSGRQAFWTLAVQVFTEPTTMEPRALQKSSDIWPIPQSVTHFLLCFFFQHQRHFLCTPLPHLLRPSFRLQQMPQISWLNIQCLALLYTPNRPFNPL